MGVCWDVVKSPHRSNCEPGRPDGDAHEIMGRRRFVEVEGSHGRGFNLAFVDFWCTQELEGTFSQLEGVVFATSKRV
jgi:hypothetical protein